MLVDGDAAVAEDSDTSSASGLETFTGTAAVTEDDDSVSSTAEQLIASNLNIVVVGEQVRIIYPDATLRTVEPANDNREFAVDDVPRNFSVQTETRTMQVAA
jgi:hypothetical protein